jgi:hypothetical protein
VSFVSLLSLSKYFCGLGSLLASDGCEILGIKLGPCVATADLPVVPSCFCRWWKRAVAIYTYLEGAHKRF